MTPELASFVLLTFNLLTFVLSSNVLLLSAWQNPNTPTGRALATFMASIVLLNISQIAVQVAGIVNDAPLNIHVLFINLSVLAFGLCTLTGFSLAVTAAGLMKQALQVISRAGAIALLLIQWPLWNGSFFTPNTDPSLIEWVYTPAGILVATTGGVYVVMGLVILWRYRRRIAQPSLTFSLALLFIGQIATLLSPQLRMIGFPSLLTVVISAILGYSLMRLQLFSPLNLRTAQLAAMQNLAQSVARHQDLPQMLTMVANQARSLLNTGAVVISLTDGDNGLIVTAQSGSLPSVIGRRLLAGEGLAGRVLQTQQPMSLANYRAWEGRSPVFADFPLYASMSVPMVNDDKTLGVLTAHEMSAGRIFSERERAVLEMLVAQAALGIRHAQLHQEVLAWRERSKPRKPGTINAVLAKLLTESTPPGYALTLMLSPNLPALSMPSDGVQKMVAEAIAQVTERTDGDTLQIDVQADGTALLIEVRCTARAAAVVSFGALAETRPDSVRIRLEQGRAQA